MLSLFLRNLLFTILQPGIVAGLIPYWMVRNEMSVVINQPLKLSHYVAILIFLIGATVMFTCILNFAVKGRGTLSPIDPTKKLVISGLYRFSRNPMYVGVILMLIGEAIFFHSISLSIYSISVFLLFNLFIVIIEEPRLQRDFKEEYIDYCKEVRRWV